MYNYKQVGQFHWMNLWILTETLIPCATLTQFEVAAAAAAGALMPAPACLAWITLTSGIFQLQCLHGPEQDKNACKAAFPHPNLHLNIRWVFWGNLSSSFIRRLVLTKNFALKSDQYFFVTCTSSCDRIFSTKNYPRFANCSQRLPEALTLDGFQQHLVSDFLVRNLIR